MWLFLDIETREMFHDPEVHVGHCQMAVLHLVCMRAHPDPVRLCRRVCPLPRDDPANPAGVMLQHRCHFFLQQLRTSEKRIFMPSIRNREHTTIPLALAPKAIGDHCVLQPASLTPLQHREHPSGWCWRCVFVKVVPPFTKRLYINKYMIYNTTNKRYMVNNGNLNYLI